jgi:hypothetical protein
MVLESIKPWLDYLEYQSSDGKISRFLVLSWQGRKLADFQNRAAIFYFTNGVYESPNGGTLGVHPF